LAQPVGEHSSYPQVNDAAMNEPSILICALALGLQACAGHSIDLDQGAGSPSNSSAPVGVDATQIHDYILDLDADDSRVYWRTPSAAQSCVFEHCGATTVSYGTAVDPITIGEQDVFFWSTSPDAPFSTGQLVSCPKTGCGTAPIEIFEDLTAPNNVSDAVDDQYYYWPSNVDIYRCPLTGCGEVPEVVAKDETTNGALVVDGNAVFWTFRVDATNPNGGSEIHSAPKDGSRSPTLIASGVGLSPYVNLGAPGIPFIAPQFTVDATTVYWLDSSSHVQSCPRTGCDGRPPVTLVATDGAKQTLRVDATGLYWLETTDLVGDWAIGVARGAVVDHVSIRFCRLTGCSNDADVRVLSPNTVERVGHFAMSSKYLYSDDLVHRM
jgi:hypothetical protein